MLVLPYNSVLERTIDDDRQRVGYASWQQRWREEGRHPDETLDSVGWQIFRDAVILGMDYGEAARLGLDGNLRQRRRVLVDLELRYFNRQAKLVDAHRVELQGVETGWEQLAWWSARLPTEQARFIYFIQEGDSGPVKIGRSRSMNTRVRDLQTGNPGELHLRQVIPGGSADEALLHARFAPARIRNEWFGLSYLPVILSFSAGIAEEALATFDGTRAPKMTLAGARFLTDRDVYAMRKDIERMVWDDHDVEAIAEYLRLDIQEVKEHLVEMTDSAFWRVSYHESRADVMRERFLQ